MEVRSLAELRVARQSGGRRYHEFLRVPAMSAGFYRLPTGDVDPQSAHAEHEVYVVMSGRAWITVGDEERAVGPGLVIYVAATVPHRFHDISEDLEVIVLFAPP
ncbi:MAG: cupin domain-containing protein, partial [Candidatus Limnocylindrales bacterium]